MDALAKAVVDAIAFLQLPDDDVIDPDSAVSATERIEHSLQSCTPGELDALKRAAAAELRAQKVGKAGPEALKFYRDFMADLGLGESGK